MTVLLASSQSSTDGGAGFVKQLRAVLSRSDPAMNLGRVLLKLSDGRAPQRVVAIGHSLGGAVAQLAALWATLRFPRADVRCISFGAPRVGNHAWKVWGR